MMALFRDRPCVGCGLWSSELNEGGYCKDCELKYRIAKNATKKINTKRNLDKCFSYTPTPFIERKIKNKVVKISIWATTPKLYLLFATEQSFNVWYGHNKGRCKTLEELWVFRELQMKLRGVNYPLLK